MKYIYKTLYSLGLHIGGYFFLTKPENYKYLLGSRGLFSIIDINTLFYQIKRSVTFLNELGKINGFLLFYYSNIDTCPYYLKMFLLNIIYYNFHHGFLDKKWSYGQLSNSFTQIGNLLSSLFYLDVKKSKKYFRYYKLVKKMKIPITHINYEITILLYRILFFTINKRLEGMSWLETLDSVKNYWRFFSFFKYYSFLKNYPDCFIFLNKNNIMNPIIESKYMKIPSILITHDSSNTDLSSYLILSNTRSNIVNIFYIVLFLFSFQHGLLHKYKSIRK